MFVVTKEDIQEVITKPFVLMKRSIQQLITGTPSGFFVKQQHALQQLHKLARVSQNESLASRVSEQKE